MVVGIMRIRFHFMSNATRDRRRILRSAVDRLRARQIFSVSDISSPDDARVGELAIAWVGKSAADADSSLDQALQLLEHVDAIIVDVEREVMHWRPLDDELPR